MTAEVAASQKLFEVVGQADCVEFHDAARELLNPARVHISVNVVFVVQVLEAEHNLLEHIEDLV